MLISIFSVANGLFELRKLSELVFHVDIIILINFQLKFTR